MKIPPERVRHAICARATLARFRILRVRPDREIRDFRPFIMTGPARSGTSLAAVLVNQFPNTIAINEPRRLYAHRLGTVDPVGQLKCCLYDVANAAVRRGRVRNKTDRKRPAALSTDTWHTGQTYRTVHVDVEPQRPLAIGVKAIMPLMEHLQTFCKGWPELRAVLLFRDPIATLRSQRQTFGWEQAQADPDSKRYRFSALAAVDPQADPITRGAQFWSAVMQTGIDASRHWPDRVMLVDYASVVRDTNSTLRRIRRFIGAMDDATGKQIELPPRDPSRRGQAYTPFTADEEQRIREITNNVYQDARRVAHESSGSVSCSDDETGTQPGGTLGAAGAS